MTLGPNPSHPTGTKRSNLLKSTRQKHKLHLSTNESSPVKSSLTGASKRYRRSRFSNIAEKHRSKSDSSVPRFKRKSPNRSPLYFSNKVESDFFNTLFQDKNFTIQMVASDGSCLYRSIALQIYGDEEYAQILRYLVHDYMKSHWDFYSNYVTTDCKNYLEDLLKSTTYGDHPEIQAIAEIFRVPIEIYTYSTEPFVVINGGVVSPLPYHSNNSVTPVRLSFHNNNHYNAIIDHTAPPLHTVITLPPNLLNKSRLLYDRCKSEQSFCIGNTSCISPLSKKPMLAPLNKSNNLNSGLQDSTGISHRIHSESLSSVDFID